MKKYFYLTLLCLSSVIALAQDKSPEQIIGERASALIDSTMSALNTRANIFNAELDKVNKLNPLDARSFTPEKIDSNITAMKEFLDYLDVYRKVSGDLFTKVQDSVEAIRRNVPQTKRKDFLKEFMDAYALDHKAFDKYSHALTDVYTNVLATVKFAKTANVEPKGDKLEFKSKEQYNSYKKMIDNVEKSNTKLISAAKKSQKATADASAAMQLAYGKVRK
jgi:hypothetical protein